ncbi:MAG: DUF4912 domain-containing protein [Leptolyngbya sp.]|nr:DUF4912 domain-containing protein [Leptolyngbya sp.]
MTHHHRQPSSLAAYLGQIVLATFVIAVALQGMPRQWVAPTAGATTGSGPTLAIAPSPEADSPAPASPSPIRSPLAGPSHDFSRWPWMAAFPALGLLLWWILRQGDPRVALPSEQDAASEVTTALTEIPAGAASQDPPQERIILTPYSQDLAYAYWELPPSAMAILQQHNYTLSLRLHDVTDGSEADPPAPPPRWNCDRLAVGDRHLPVAHTNRDYSVDLGYEDETATWHSLARSAPVRIAPSAPDPVTAEDTDEGESATQPRSDQPLPDSAAVAEPRPQPAIASLIAQGNRRALATWEIPPDRISALQAAHRAPTIRLYDVTELPGNFALGPNSMQVFNIELTPQGSLTIPIAVEDRDYLIEVGYLTEDGQWQVVAKSSPVRVAAA